MDITRHSSVAEFFHEAVVDALGNQALETSEFTESYLVGLLGQFAVEPITDEPLAMMLAGVVGPAGRVTALKQVGDTALYVAGFFAESLNRKLVDADYYIELGGAAYRELARRMANSSVQAVYEELSAKFPRFVEVLAEVSSQVDFVGSDVGKLYQQWFKTRSEWLERRLRSMGVLIGPAGSDGKVYVQ
jgi:hypothetical protein